MINEETMTFELINEQGIKTEYTILFSFISDKTNKHYLVYTDNELDNDGNLRIMASIINEETEEITPIVSDEEMEIVEEKLLVYKNELAKVSE